MGGNFFYAKLAGGNLKKNRQTYLPYLLTCICTVIVFYMMASLSGNSRLAEVRGGMYICSIMMLGMIVVGIFSIIFLFYTHSFLIKRRKKEFGLYRILGMERRHVSRILFWETIYTAVFALVLGLTGGILFGKLAFMLVLRMLNAQIVLGFEIPPSAVLSTLALFGIIFAGTFLNSLRQIQLVKSAELINGEKHGEKEPKSKWLLTLIGLLTLGAGYYLAVTIENPMMALLLLFVAVILVMIGTYCLFTAGSVTVLKAMRKCKSFYYKPKHFVSVSGMIYRMKQNAVGLANICILSTGVLLVVSTTVSVYIGTREQIEELHPYQVNIELYENDEEKERQAKEWIAAALNACGAAPVERVEYDYVTLSTTVNDGEYLVPETYSENDTYLYLYTVEDYRKNSGRTVELQPDEVLIYPGTSNFSDVTLRALGREYQVKQFLSEDEWMGVQKLSALKNLYVVLPDREALEYFGKTEQEDTLNHYIGMDFSTEEISETVYNELRDTSFLNLRITCRKESGEELAGINGGLLFLGIFLGLLFAVGTVLIIYYKQISEGYEDQGRFSIMQKVGMSREEVKRTISSQVLTVFFLPLAAAGVHIVFAFHMVTRCLRAMSLVNVPLFAMCTLICFLVFAVFYIVIYGLTARVYYRLVYRKGRS